jgi:hypothetical protein
VRLVRRVHNDPRVADRVRLELIVAADRTRDRLVRIEIETNRATVDRILGMDRKPLRRPGVGDHVGLGAWIEGDRPAGFRFRDDAQFVAITASRLRHRHVAGLTVRKRARERRQLGFGDVARAIAEVQAAQGFESLGRQRRGRRGFRWRHRRACEPQMRDRCPGSDHRERRTAPPDPMPGDRERAGIFDTDCGRMRHATIIADARVSAVAGRGFVRGANDRRAAFPHRMLAIIDSQGDVPVCGRAVRFLHDTVLLAKLPCAPASLP